MKTSNTNPEFNKNLFSGPVLLFRLNEEASGILNEAPFQETGRNAKTLAKYSDFRIVLEALKKGAVLHEHQAKGCISIQTLEGRIRVGLRESAVELSKGELLALDNAISHAVEALEDSIFLITMSFNAET